VVAKKRLHGFKLRETDRSTPEDSSMKGNSRMGGHAKMSQEQESVEVVANDLLAEIEVWKQTSHFTRAHARVQVRLLTWLRLCCGSP
jgi:hypothetical protein